MGKGGINDHYSLVLNSFKSSPEAFNNFFALKNHDDQLVKFVFNYLSDFQNGNALKKSCITSTDLRITGNKYFAVKNNAQASRFYTESLAFAPLKSEEYCLALSNRSASLLEIGAVQEAIQDIELALNCSSLPSQVKDKLLRRKAKCQSVNRLSQWVIGAGKIPKLPSVNDYFDSASSKIRLGISESSGRSLIANNDICTGEILIVEKPYCTVPLPDSRYTHCSHCLKRILNLLPCLNCPTVSYCSTECRKVSWDSYHKTECLVMGELIELNVDHFALLILRTLLKAIHEEDSLESFKNKIENHTESSTYMASDFMNIYNLVGNKEGRSAEDLLHKSFVSAVLLKALSASTELFGKISSDSLFFAGGILLRLRQSYPCNAHEIAECQLQDELKEIGSAACATLSLINHSCDPNVIRGNFGEVIVLRAIRPISANEEILDNYGYHFAVLNKNERQKSLQCQYYFTCQCPACVNDWPVFNTLPSNPMCKTVDNKIILQVKHWQQTIEKVMEQLLNKTLEDDPLPILYSAMDFLHVHVCRPWSVFNRCEEIIKHCLNFIANHFFPREQRPSIYYCYNKP